MAYAPRSRRPVGVAILAVLVILAGVILTLLALLTILAGLLVPLLLGIGVIALILSLILLAAGFGLWNLRPWAWWLAMIVLVLTIISQLSGVGLAGGFRNLSTGQLVAVVLPILMFIYLLAVRGTFRSRAASVPPR